MKISDLKKVFTGAIDVMSFKKLIASEVAQYEQLHSKRGSSIPISVVEDDVLFFGRDEIVFLCKLSLEEYLNKYMVAYIADSISLSACVKFESDLVKEYLDLFCNVGDDERLSRENILTIMNRMKSS